MRAPLTLLLLMHYLLTGVLGGTVAELARPAAPSAAHPYVHSAKCQRTNYLRLDCFDSCNGRQTALQTLAKDLKKQHEGFTVKQTLDYHLLGALVKMRPPRYARAFATLPASPATADELAGYYLLESPPPQA